MSEKWDGIDRRSSGGLQLHESSIEKIAQCISSEMQSRFTVPSETHKHHHDYIENLIECKRARSELYQRLLEHLLKSGLLAFGIFILLAFWESFKNHIKQ